LAEVRVVFSVLLAVMGCDWAARCWVHASNGIGNPM
jgi:hypothetical protein